jgi:hypothetical protein
MKLKYALLSALVVAVLSINAVSHPAHAARPLTDSEMVQRGWAPHQMGNPGFYRSTPIGYAYVNQDGSKASGTANITTSYNSSAQWYEIKFTGVNYFYSHFSTTVTHSIPIGGASCRTDSVGGKLLVVCYTLQGANTQAAFGFITF